MFSLKRGTQVSLLLLQDSDYRYRKEPYSSGNECLSFGKLEEMVIAILHLKSEQLHESSLMSQL